MYEAIQRQSAVLRNQVWLLEQIAQVWLSIYRGITPAPWPNNSLTWLFRFEFFIEGFFHGRCWAEFPYTCAKYSSIFTDDVVIVFGMADHATNTIVVCSGPQLFSFTELCNCSLHLTIINLLLSVHQFDEFDQKSSVCIEILMDYFEVVLRADFSCTNKVLRSYDTNNTFNSPPLCRGLQSKQVKWCRLKEFCWSI